MSHSLVRILGAVAGILGGILYLAAHAHRRPGADLSPRWNPLRWRPIWRAREELTPRGCRMLWAGFALVAMGMVVVFGWPFG
jgi:hypothetical protein